VAGGVVVSARTVLHLLLLVVAGSAAVLSFAALRDLALICGFAPWLAWLLPVVVDAGAAAGSLVWLGGWSAESARRFARSLALALLGLSVAANALGHGLAAFALAPAWWVVVVVSAVAPAVLGAVVHLAVLVGRPVHQVPEAEFVDDVDPVDEHGLSRMWEHAEPVRDRATELIDAGAGRRRLARELGITEHEARQLIDRTRRTSQDSPEQDTTPPWVPAINGSGRTIS
jgi:hypothetical protein